MEINESLKCLITANHVINKDLANKNIAINLKIRNKDIQITLDNRWTKFNEMKDFTVIEIKDLDIELIKKVKFLDYDLNYIKGYE